MKRSWLNNIVAGVLVAALVSAPISVNSDEPPPPQEIHWGACLVVAAGIAAGVGIYLVTKKCQPKYYCMTDNEKPPTFWVGTASKKECEINGWTRLSGPYSSPSECGQCPPAETNLVEQVSQPVRLVVHESTDLRTWNAVHEEVADLDDFVFFPANVGPAKFYRVSIAP